MPAKIQDFSDFAEQNTLIFKVPEYIAGEPTGKIIEWKIPPVKLETEIAIRTQQNEQLKELTKTLQDAADAEEGEETPPEVDPTSDVRCMGDYWAPIIALYVKTPPVDKDELKANYPGSLLRAVGQAAQSFFLFGSLPEEEKEPEKEPETSPKKGSKKNP